jgi:flagellar protein FlgJ
MEIGDVSSLYLEDARFAVSSLGAGKNAPGSALKQPGLSGNTGGEIPFAELLEKNYGKAGRDETAALPRTPGLQAQPLTPPLSSTASLPTPHSSPSTSPLTPLQVDKTSKLYEQCEALETFLVKILLSGLRNTVQKTGLVDEGFAGKMYEDMLYDEYAKDLTRNAGFGMAELAYLELTGQRGKLLKR